MAKNEESKVEPGRVLTSKEVEEYNSYHNAQLPLPDKFASVVIEGTQITGRVYRYANEQELKDAKAEGDRLEKDRVESAAATKALRDEAIQRVADENNRVEVPEMPSGAGSSTGATGTAVTRPT